MKKAFKSIQKDIQRNYFESSKLIDTYEYINNEPAKKDKDHIPYLLQDYKDNFYKYSECLAKYFSKDENNIDWWHGTTPTNNPLSSQIACLNHLFYIKNNYDAVLKLAQNINTNISNVYILENDTEQTRGYISFEVVSEFDHLNESRRKDGKLSRGSNCTSIDAIILAELDGERTLLVIEWKYVEKYSNEDKSQSKGGETRKKRYDDLIKNSKFIKSDIDENIYYTEPFYQLMRQTLWAEQMIKKENQQKEKIQASDFIHIHVIPNGNTSLLQKVYSKKGGLVETWQYYLTEPNKYVHIDPQNLLKGIVLPDKLKEYLNNRYWRSVL